MINHFCFILLGIIDHKGWCGHNHDSASNWIEIDFSEGAGIRGIVVQTPKDAHLGYVTSVSLEFVLLGSTSWQYLSSDPTQEMVFLRIVLISIYYMIHKKDENVFKM